MCACLFEDGKDRNFFNAAERDSWEELFTGREFEDTTKEEMR